MPSYTSPTPNAVRYHTALAEIFRKTKPSFEDTVGSSFFEAEKDAGTSSVDLATNVVAVARFGGSFHSIALTETGSHDAHAQAAP